MSEKYEKYKEVIKTWNKNNSDKMKGYLRKSREVDDKRRLLNNARGRSKRKFIEFSIDRDDINIPNVCPYLKTKFVFGDYNTSMSLDRIDPNKGYVKGNIQVVSLLANKCKSNLDLATLVTFAEGVLKMHKTVLKSI